MSRGVYLFIKRGFDVMSSTLALIVFSPLWIVIIIGIKLSSKGPIFYTSERVGKGKTPFRFYKFRSMHIYNPSDVDEKNEGGFIANANRMFAFGEFLRRSKLDETPQLLNVLLGDMSVIGPRPLPADVAGKYYTGRYECVSDVVPGLACLDSLYDYAHGELFVASEDEYRQKVLPIRNELARMYVERQGVGLDIYCIARTIQLMFQITIMKKSSFVLDRYEVEAGERLSKEMIMD